MLDLHAHVVPAEVADLRHRPGGARWPVIQHRSGDADVLVDGSTYRTVNARAWDPDRRIADMDPQGVRVQVLSPMPLFLSYWAPAEVARDFCRDLNARVAGLVATAPQRFLGLGIVPLQDPGLASAELAGVEALGLHGVLLGSNVNGLPLGHPRLRDFFAALASRDLPAFVHAIDPGCGERLVGPGVLENLVGFPTEIGLSAASVITGGLLDEVPGLRLCWSHGGGSLVALLPRLAHGWTIFPALADRGQGDGPLDLARRMWFDTLVYDGALIERLVGTFGESRLVLGSDYPFVVMEEPLGRHLRDTTLSAPVRSRIAWDNARAFLGPRAEAAG